MLIGIDPQYRVAVRPGGQPVDMTGQVPLGGLTVALGPEVSVARMSTELVDAAAAQVGGRVAAVRELSGLQLVVRAAAVLRHRETCRFDAATGAELSFAQDSLVGRTPEGAQVYPQISPAVIGLVATQDGQRVLLGRNAQRAQYFSLIAGYVELGETIEAAFVRELREETGVLGTDVRYWGSQPWPMSGSVMLGVTATCLDPTPVGPTDGELVETRWVTRAELAQLPLPAPGSIAHTMISWWANHQEHLEKGGNHD